VSALVLLQLMHCGQNRRTKSENQQNWVELHLFKLCWYCSNTRRVHVSWFLVKDHVTDEQLYNKVPSW